MAAELIFAPEADRDIAEAYDWHENSRVGLGEEFLSQLDACIQGIRRNPKIHAIVFEDYRRALMRRFPYAVFYECDGAAVRIYSVFHTARDPEKWRRRLT